MDDMFKKDSAQETNKVTTAQKERNVPQRFKAPEATERADSPRNEDLLDVPDILDLLASFQEMRTEERELVEAKQVLLKKQQKLQSRLVEEIDKKQMAIDKLKTEIPDIQNRCRQLGQVLGVDIYR